MPLLYNRARMTTATTGTGTITLGSAVTSFQSFADAGVSDAETIRYVIEDGNDWEIGNGTYTASGTTLSRTVLESSNADAAISLSGSAEVYIDAAAEDIPVSGVDFVDKSGGTFTGDVTIMALLETEDTSSSTSYALNPTANGTRCTLTLTATTSLSDSMSDGESMTLRIINGDTQTLNWVAGTKWSGGAPTLTGDDLVRFEKWGTDLIGYYGLGVA